MLPKTRRLSHRDFLVAKTHGKSYKTPHFSAIVYLHSPALTHSSSRFSIVTSSKLDKRAVVRNRLRRRIYSWLKANDYRLSADIIIYPYKSMLNLPYEEIGPALNSFLSSLALGHA